MIIPEDFTKGTFGSEAILLAQNGFEKNIFWEFYLTFYLFNKMTVTLEPVI